MYVAPTLSDFHAFTEKLSRQLETLQVTPDQARDLIDDLSSASEETMRLLGELVALRDVIIRSH